MTLQNIAKTCNTTALQAVTTAKYGTNWIALDEILLGIISASVNECIRTVQYNTG